MKVQNWDKTISTIPTYSFVSDSFKNWRGMSEAGGRRIKRSIVLKSGSIKFCNQEMISRFENFHLIKEFLRERVNEIQDYDYRKNLYFFIHEWFRNGSNDIVGSNGFSLNIPSYYPLVNGLHPIGNVVVTDFELYKIDASNNPKACLLYTSPSPRDH